MSQASYKEWLKTNINEGTIYCCTENDIKLDTLPIGNGAFGVVYKATIKQKNGIGNIAKNILGRKTSISDTAVAVKILIPDSYGNCEEDLYQQFVKEVVYYHLICLPIYFVHGLI